jgi:hypothetical protein
MKFERGVDVKKATGEVVWVTISEAHSLWGGKITPEHTLKITHTLGETNILCQEWKDIQSGVLSYTPIRRVRDGRIDL